MKRRGARSGFKISQTNSTVVVASNKKYNQSQTIDPDPNEDKVIVPGSPKDLIEDPTSMQELVGCNVEDDAPDTLIVLDSHGGDVPQFINLNDTHHTDQQLREYDTLAGLPEQTEIHGTSAKVHR